MNDSIKKCKWCDKRISPTSKCVEVNIFTGKGRKKDGHRARTSQWNFHARCFEDVSGIPVLPQELKAVIQLPKAEMKNEFANPETTTRENGHETVAPVLP